MKSRIYFLQYRHEQDSKRVVMPVIADTYQIAVTKLLINFSKPDNPILTGSIVHTQPFLECLK